MGLLGSGSALLSLEPMDTNDLCQLERIGMIKDRTDLIIVSHLRINRHFLKAWQGDKDDPKAYYQGMLNKCAGPF